MSWSSEQQVVGRLAPDHRRDQRLRALLDHHRQLADGEPAESAGLPLRAKESATKSRMAVSIPEMRSASLAGRSGAQAWASSRPVSAMDQEDLLDPVDQRVLEDDLRVGDAGAPGLEPPAEPAGRKAVLERAVDGGDQPRQRLGDGLSDRGAEHGEDGGGDGAGVPANRLADGVLDRRRERTGELAVPPGAEGDGLGQQLGQLLAGEPGGVEPALELMEPPPLGAEDQLAQLREVRATSCGACSQGARSSGMAQLRGPFFPGRRRRRAAEPGGHVGEQPGERGAVGLGDLSSWCDRVSSAVGVASCVSSAAHHGLEEAGRAARRRPGWRPPPA